MDQAFFLRAKRLLDQRERVRPDHRMLRAVIESRQSATPTARAARRCPAASLPQDERAAVAALLLAETDWRQAAEDQRGCFSRAGARRRVKEA